MEKRYYHLFANGDDAKNFIICEADFKAAFNRFAVCSHISGATVVAGSVEDSHPHALLWGTNDECIIFKNKYEDLSTRYIVQHRGSLEDVNLHCELYRIDDETYLKRVACYVIVQATKDGKSIMPYDYEYGTGPLYFRSPKAIMPWLVDSDGSLAVPTRLSDLKQTERNRICGTKIQMPDNWTCCNGFILPDSYVDVPRYERIFITHNCFRTFLSSGKAKDDPVREQMSIARGVSVEDLEARKLCSDSCLELFGKQTTRHLDMKQRLQLATELRRKYRLTFRQLSFLTKILESDLRKYVK